MSFFEPLPLAIGFTGHRDISPDDEDRLRAALKQRLKQLSDENAPTRLRVFTGLAEGGDMLFAEAATALGIEMIAVMPVPVDDFVRDFEQPAHPDRNAAELRQRFDRLIPKAAAVHVVPAPEGVSPDSVKSYGPERNAQYAAVGAFIVRQSLILIALWDSITTDKPGGTGDVVRFKLQGVPPQPGETEVFPAPADGGPVLQLGSTRVDSMGDVEPAWEEHYPEPRRGFEREFKKALKQFRRFNRDALRFSRRHPDRVATSRGYLLAPEIELSPAQARIIEVYGVADAVAISLQKRARRILGAITALAVAMVLTFEFYGHLPPTWATRYWITGYFAAFLIAFLIYLLDSWCQFYTRFLDYRGLAEGMRVQIFWHLAGLRELVADNYLYRQRGELRWVRDALRAVMTGMPSTESRMDLVRKYWIDDQSKYFTRTAKREADVHEVLGWCAVILFGLGFVMAVYMLLSEWRAETEPLQRDSWLVVGPILLVAFLPALAAAIKGYALKRAYAEHAKQYERMARIFALARKRLGTIEEMALATRTRSVLLALGREALAENAEWILLHRERLIEPPI